MSSSARHTIKAVLESVYGTTPATPALKTFRNTGTTLAVTKDTIDTEELRPDRQVADQRHGTKQVGGDISFEMSYGSHDDYMEAVLCGTWAVKLAPYVATTISAAAADNSINDSANAFPVYEPGDVISISGFTGTAGNNRHGRVVSRTASKIVLQTIAPLVNDAAGESVTLTCLTGQLKAGVARRSFSVVRNFGDIVADSTGKPFHRFTGCELNKLSLQVAPNAMAKGSFGVIGQDLALEAAEFAGATDGGTTTTSPMDSMGGTLSEGGVTNGYVTEITQDLENGLEARFVVGSDKTLLPSIDKSMLTGQIQTYFEDAVFLEKFLNETESSLDYKLTDKPGNRYRFFYPRIKYNGGQPDVSGQPSLQLSMPFMALYSAAHGTQLIIERSPALSV